MAKIGNKTLFNAKKCRILAFKLVRIVYARNNYYD